MWRAGSDRDSASNSGREKRHLGTLFAEDDISRCASYEYWRVRPLDRIGGPWRQRWAMSSPCTGSVEAVLFEAGELELWQALDLMGIIAPGLGINERGLDADALMELSIADGWDNNDRVAVASEVFRLVTGVPLDVEARIGAGVDLAGLGVRIFGSGTVERPGCPAATSVIKQAMEGRLTPESLAGILGGVDE